MSTRRDFQPRRRDANEPEIIAALVAMGAAVARITDRNGFPDLVVAYSGVTVLLEVKLPGGKLSPPQERWWSQPWPGPRFIVTSPELAVTRIMEALR